MPDVAEKPIIPFHVQAARASWVAPLIGIIIFNTMGRNAEFREVKFAVACFAVSTYAFGLVFAGWAIVGAFRKGPLKILIPASIGLLINGGIIIASVSAIITAERVAEQARSIVRHPGVDNTPSNPADSPWGDLKVTVGGTPVAAADLVVILLHGYGAPGDDLVELGNVIDAPPRTAFLFPEGPDALEQGGRAWYNAGGNNLDESRDRIRDLLSVVQQTSPECDIVVGGFSQGAILASNLLTEAESSGVKGVILYSPAFDLRHLPDVGDPVPQVLIAHGRSDRVLAFSESEQLNDKLQMLGCDVTLVSFEGGHTISPSGIQATGEFLKGLKPVAEPSGTP